AREGAARPSRVDGARDERTPGGVPPDARDEPASPAAAGPAGLRALPRDGPHPPRARRLVARAPAPWSPSLDALWPRRRGRVRAAVVRSAARRGLVRLPARRALRGAPRRLSRIPAGAESLAFRRARAGLPRDARRLRARRLLRARAAPPPPRAPRRRAHRRARPRALLGADPAPRPRPQADRTRVGALAPRFAARDDDHPSTHGRGRDAGRLRAHDVLDVLPDVSRPAHGERLLGLHPRQHGAAEA